MNWLHYILEANLYLSIFYIGYCLVLNKETHYALNRAYLIGSCMLAFVLPFLQLGVLKHPAPVLQQQVLTTVNYIPVQQQQVTYAIAQKPVINFTWQDGILYLYLFGVVVLFAIFMVKLYRLYVLSRSKSTRANDYNLVEIDGQDTAFSFFNYLFINVDVAAAETIIRHELVHIRQKHSADILFVELLKIVCWFNPFIYLLQISLKAVHEYIADEKTAGSTDVSDYSTFLVNNAYGLGGSSITHSFFNYNLLKRRIIMLHQKRSGGLARLKYLVAVPICAGLLCVSTLAFSKTYGWVDLAPAGIKPAATANTDETNNHTGPHRIDKANTSPQVPEPNRELSVRQNGKSIITDKFSEQLADGSIKNYTAYNISNKDVVDLAKKGIEVNVLYDVKIDSANHSIPPPPPPAPPQPKATYTGKGYKFREDGYLIRGKANYRVIITEKDGTEKEYFRNSATTAEISLLKNKYGYTFPTIQIYPKLPPPPPAPPVKISFLKSGYTGKGFKYTERKFVQGNEVNLWVSIYDKDGTRNIYTASSASAADIKMLSEKYGYTFPAKGNYSLMKAFIVKFPQPVITRDPPPARVGNVSYTSKGIKVTEYQYLDGNKIDFSANILDKDKDLVIATYFKSQCDAATLKLLREKYGYTFPANGKYELAPVTKTTPLPESAVRFVSPRVIPDDPKDVTAPSPTEKMVRFPPPVIVRDKALPKASSWPPPPPAPPTGKSDVAPTGNKSTLIDNNSAPNKIILNGIALTNEKPKNYATGNNPLVVINGNRYYVLSSTKSFKSLKFSADTVTIFQKTNTNTVQKWGNDATNGAIYLKGNVSISI
jgi:hypothetical protein